ncbi:MAG: glycosyl hydrolase 53 family protein [Ignavibacteriaceae bacterium]|jgi:arabinogalactan endo-1,4-beta-galactosidase
MKIYFVLFFLLLFTLSASSQSSDNFIRGVDISTTPQIINAGGVWKSNNVPQDVLDIFKSNGANYVRLRLWHSPSNGYCGLDSTLAFAKLVKAKGFKFLLDIHYSDTWADPGKQAKPAAWNGLLFNTLVDSVRSYTKRVIKALKDQNTLPDMVQVGNEITPGMLFPEGKISTSGWGNFTTLLKAGIQGVKDVDSTTIKIMIHIDRGGDNATSRWYFDNLLSYGVSFDIIGLSYYPWWHGSLSQAQNNLNDLATRYNKDIIIVETAYPWNSQSMNDGYNVGFDPTKLPSGYPVNPQGQRDFLTYLIRMIKNTTSKKGIGFFYWEPADISVPPVGSAWENYAVFDFTYNALPALKAFQNNDSLAAVKITLRLNTSTLGDTLKSSAFVQARGQVYGVSSGFFPSGEKFAWDQSSQITMKNVGGDYWQYQFQMYPADELQFLFWAGHSASVPSYRNLGWEAQIIPFDSSTVNYRVFTAGLKDTVLDVEYFNGTAGKIPQYFTPILHKTDSIGILFRVNVAQLIKSGLFDAAANMTIAVRGDSASSTGILSWNSNKLMLEKEPISVGSGTFWSGVAYFPKNKISSGASINYKFFVNNSAFGGWESGIENRVFKFPESDTTLVWKFFNDKFPITGIENDAQLLVDKFKLYQNYPNPFNPKTTIKFSVPEKTMVHLKVFNLLGEVVKTLVNETKEAGEHSIEWNSLNELGNPVNSGIYLIRMDAGSFSQMRKMILLK